MAWRDEATARALPGTVRGVSQYRATATAPRKQQQTELLERRARLQLTTETPRHALVGYAGLANLS